MPTSEGGSKLHHFEIPCVEGDGGADLPALLGLKSISAHEGVIETKPSHERMTFPGPGGYEITWAPGAKHFKLEQENSGHLMIPCDDVGNVRTESVLPEQPLTLHAHSAELAVTGQGNGASASSS